MCAHTEGVVHERRERRRRVSTGGKGRARRSDRGAARARNPKSIQSENPYSTRATKTVHTQGEAMLAVGHAAYARKDWPEAMKAFQRSAEAGSAEGAWELSLMHAHGKTGVVDKEEARKWLKIAAEGGAVKAQMFLAQMSTFGRGGYEKDESVAFEYLERAADQGNAHATHQLGVDVDRGHVVDHHRDAVARAVVEDVVEQRGLARAEEAGEHRHRLCERLRERLRQRLHRLHLLLHSGDLLMHDRFIEHGVNVTSGERYALIGWFKDRAGVCGAQIGILLVLRIAAPVVFQRVDFIAGVDPLRVSRLPPHLVDIIAVMEHRVELGLGGRGVRFVSGRP